MQLRVVKRRTKELAAFNDSEWPDADLEHYGEVGRWDGQEFRIVAREGKAIVGSLHITLKRGVCEVNALIVAKSARGTGVGTALMKKAEELALERDVHKMYLETGKGWQAESFYQKLGFRQNTVLPKHYFGHDFVLYEKMLR